MDHDSYEAYAAYEADWLRDAYLEQHPEAWEIEQDRDDDNGVDAEAIAARPAPRPHVDPECDDVPF